MAKVRIGFSTQFELENELVGIGTDNPTNTLQALGNIHAPNAKAIGVSTLTTFDGFVDTKASISGLEGSEQGSISGEIIIEGSATVSTGATFTSGPENLTVTDSFTLPGISEDKPSVGTTRFNENLRALEFYTGVEWRAVNSYVDMGNRGRGVWAGGEGVTGIIEYVDLSSGGRSQDFGYLSVSRTRMENASSSTRGCFGGGKTPSNVDTIDYITIASAGNAIDFGNITEAGTLQTSGQQSSSTRGIFDKGGPNTSLHYIEIATLGDSIDFGDFATPSVGTLKDDQGAATFSPTRGVWKVPTGGNTTGSIQHVTIASKGNAIETCLALYIGYNVAGGGNGIRGVFAGSYAAPGDRKLNCIEYVTMSSLGETFDFGSLPEYRACQRSASTNTKVFFGGGYYTPSTTASGSTYSYKVDYITIASTGSTTDFGELTNHHTRGSCASDSHGGLGGF